MIPRIRVHERHVLLWLLGATMLAMAMVALWLVFSHRTGQKLAPGGTAHVRWMRPGQHSLVADYFDPSVMSLPDPRGFSGNAWRHVATVPPPSYEPERVPAFLGLPANAPVPVLLPEPPLGELAQTAVAPATLATDPEILAPVSPATNSVIEILGALSDRRILQPPVLPLASAPSRSTRLLVAVTGAGRVRYAVVERSSGNESLDGAAVAAVRRVWFAPEPDADPLALTWGTVRLVWAERI